jgi:oxygen-independent coproporphyrinogen-3 oxidase
LTADWQQGGFGLYIHWPYCEAKCPYCDFNSHVSQSIDQRAWRDAYLRELARGAEETKGRVLNAVYFGGGTPSLMDPDTVADVITAIKSHWATGNDLEITLEANPGSVEAGRFEAYRQGGVSRVSMGIQALNDADLKRLGRIHTAAEALKAFDIARSTFERVSFDLIYGRQDQTMEAWEQELKQALTLAIDHISLYQLTIEQGTAFGDRYAIGKLRGLPTEDLGADMFERTQEICDEMGMAAYEVSNHARDGAQSRHNLIYWRYGDYLGIGPGAHGRLTLDGQKHSTECFSNPQRWLLGSKEGATERPREALSGTAQAQEMLMMGLRLKEGVDLERFAKLNGDPLSETRVSELVDLGMVHQRDGRLVVLNQGVIVLNAILAQLLND